MMNLRRILPLLGLALLTAAACTPKKEKTCESEDGKSGAALTAPWTDLKLPLDGGSVCKSDKSSAKVIFTKGGNFVDAASKLKGHLEGAGWKIVDFKTEMYGEGDDANGSVEMEVQKEKRKIGVSVHSYPRSVWKDEPYSVYISKRGGDGIDTDW